MKRAIFYTMFAIVGSFLNYLFWGFLDGMGGVNGFLSAMGSLSQALGNLWSGQICLRSASEGFFCVPTLLWLLVGMGLVIFFLFLLIALFIQMLDKDDKDKKEREDAAQRRLMHEAILDALEEHERRKKLYKES